MDYIHKIVLSNGIAEPLTYVFSISLSQDVFSDRWKVAIVIHVFKTGD